MVGAERYKAARLWAGDWQRWETPVQGNTLAGNWSSLRTSRKEFEWITKFLIRSEAHTLRMTTLYLFMNIVQLEVFTNWASLPLLSSSPQRPFYVVFRHLVADYGIRQNLLEPKLCFAENLRYSTLKNTGDSICCLYMPSFSKEKKLWVCTLGLKLQGWASLGTNSNSIINKFTLTIFFRVKNSPFWYFSVTQNLHKLESNRFLQLNHSGWLILCCILKPI